MNVRLQMLGRVWDEQMGNFGMECVSGEECRVPCCVSVVQRAVVLLGSAEVPLEFG